MHYRVLIADLSITVQRVVELAFAGQDIDVLTADDGAQAIARVVVEHPDIVLADVRLPKYTGYEIAALVKARWDLQHIPVLLVAGAFEQLDEARMHRAGCDGLIMKPFEPSQLLSRVRALLPRVGSWSPRTTAAGVCHAKRLASICSDYALDSPLDAPGESLDAVLATLRATSHSTSQNTVSEKATEDGGSAKIVHAPVEELVQRVVARLHDEQLGQAITDQMGEAVGQLLREEIARLQNRR